MGPQGGTITSVTAGAGLTGGGAAGPISLAADTTVLQARVTGTCAAGTAIGTVNADGTVACNTGLSGLTANTIIKATGTTTAGNSLLTDNATTLAYNTNKFTVAASTGNGTFAGSLSVGNGLTVTNGISADTLNLSVIYVNVTGSQNDWAPSGINTASVVMATPNTQISITGIQAPTGFVPGRQLCVMNMGTSTISFNNQSASSAAANRLVLVGGNTWQLVGGTTQQMSICFIYDNSAQRWTQIQDTYFPQINAGSSGQFAVSTAGATTTTTMALTGFANVQAATATAMSVTDPTTFATATTDMISYGVNSNITTTRASGTGNLTNVALYGTATGGQFNVALRTGDGKVQLTQTSGTIEIGTSKQIIQTGTPSANHGSLGTGSTDWVGNVTGVGAFTSVTLTYSTAFPNRSWCQARPNSGATPEDIYVTNSASAPVFNCFNTTTGAAANCNDFSYQCVGE